MVDYNRFRKHTRTAWGDKGLSLHRWSRGDLKRAETFQRQSAAILVRLRKDALKKAYMLAKI